MDYLNSISAPQKQNTLNPVALWLLIGGVIAAVVVIFLMIMSSAGGPKSQLRTFAVEITDLQTVSSEAQEQIQSSELRSLNSSLTITLTNANRDIADILTAENIDLEKDSNEKAAVESETEELKSTLEDARFNAVYDRTYSSEIAFYLKNLRTQMSDMYNGSSSDELKEYLEKVDSDIEPLANDFASFKAS